MATYNATGPGPARLNLADHVKASAFDTSIDLYRLGTVDGTGTIDAEEEAEFNAFLDRWARKLSVTEDLNPGDYDSILFIRGKAPDGVTLAGAQRGDA